MTEQEPPITVDTNGVQQLVGRTIVAAYRYPPSGKPYEMYEESLILTLDDGSEWEFSGNGYDFSQLEIVMTPAKASAHTPLDYKQ